MCRGVDAEGQAADDGELVDPLGEPFDEGVAHRLAVGRSRARADYREAAHPERPKFAPQVDDVGRVRNVAQQGRIFGVGRGDGPDAVAAAVEQLALGGGEALALEDGP